MVDTFGDLSKMEIVQKKGTSCLRLFDPALLVSLIIHLVVQYPSQMRQDKPIMAMFEVLARRAKWSRACCRCANASARMRHSGRDKPNISDTPHT